MCGPKFDWRRLFLLGFAALMIGLVGSDDAHARGRRAARRGYSTGSVQLYPESDLQYAVEDSLQAVAQARAEAMASLELMTHDIHSYAAVPSWAGRGVGEGVGTANVADPRACATCIVGRYVVADAHARGRSGMVYRVRFFR